MNDHDDSFDLHTFAMPATVLIHAHTEAGYLWVLERLDDGLIADGEDLSIPTRELPEMLADVEAAGLTIEQTLDSRSYQTRITSAPEAYDGFGTQTLEMSGSYRSVAILNEHLEWQVGRYASGMYPALTPEQFSERAALGLV